MNKYKYTKYILGIMIQIGILKVRSIYTQNAPDLTTVHVCRHVYTSCFRYLTDRCVARRILNTC